MRGRVCQSALIALSGSEGGFAEVESPVVTVDQRAVANERGPTSYGQQVMANNDSAFHGRCQKSI